MPETKRNNEGPEIMKKTGKMYVLDTRCDRVFEVADRELFRKLLAKDSGRYIEA